MKQPHEEHLHQLILRCLDGDTEAFGDLYDLTIQDVQQTVFFLLDQKHDAEDVIHDIYLEVYQSLPGYDASRPFRAWLKGLCIRQIQNYRRRNWKLTRLFDRVSSFSLFREDANWSKPVDDQIIGREIWEKVMSLPFPYRSVLILRYLFDYSQEDIAAILQLPLGTVKSRLHHALRKAKIKLSEMPLGLAEE
ncbi:sigma-70 family RNA polymerase sigma factor [Brevibacillus ruminantium]|uniref:Sigma-70 family RNA polymerase sigma factor n=1 Tax=Brevibacillus ruminantium TaxID=2950604 RepID=A0ABY4WH07_9BACL|nr:sigma-70 family RNA polymerase sigma factor [Brevibacillus ruminantium]USG66435.1 sigma-70 family RNA polymerase sigma factor [Brevibacillus ruminantium]